MRPFRKRPRPEPQLFPNSTPSLRPRLHYPGPSLTLSPGFSPPTWLRVQILWKWLSLQGPHLAPGPASRPGTSIPDLRSSPHTHSKLSRQSATEIPLPMLPLAETEKLIREKDEEVSGTTSLPLHPQHARQGPGPRRRGPAPGSRDPTVCTLAPHSCAACRRCWRRCRPRCSRARLRASSRTLSEVPRPAGTHLRSACSLSPAQCRVLRCQVTEPPPAQPPLRGLCAGSRAERLSQSRGV